MLAGAVAFRIFLFLVPYTFVAVCVFGVGASASDQDPGSLARDAGIGGLAAKAMSSVGDLSTSQRLVSLVVAGFALLLATRVLLKVLRIVHASVWHTRGKVRSSRRGRCSLFIVGVTLALGLAILVGKLRGESLLLGLIATLLYIAVPFGVWLLFSWYLPHPPDLPWTALIPGAVFFGVGMEILHVVTVYWIAHEVESKTDTVRCARLRALAAAVGLPDGPFRHDLGGRQRVAVEQLPGASTARAPAPAETTDGP